ncbi:9055_t:CDS:2 [Racocetra fulgida]|uniref:9055_t:CDS:1 n=1 Tax=Racocetra fulgida TaxID=60492 RepID=A0A9N9F8A6_9GLOM|nr:9055_t:CDS:2 [Racocetra fulgida]
MYEDLVEAELESEEDHSRCKVEEIVKEKREKSKEVLIPLEVKSSSKPNDKEPISKSRWNESSRTMDEDTSLETSRKSSR